MEVGISFIPIQRPHVGRFRRFISNLSKLRSESRHLFVVKILIWAQDSIYMFLDKFVNILQI